MKIKLVRIGSYNQNKEQSYDQVENKNISVTIL